MWFWIICTFADNLGAIYLINFALMILQQLGAGWNILDPQCRMARPSLPVFKPRANYLQLKYLSLKIFQNLKIWIWRAFEICCKDWQIAGNERETPEPEFKCKQLVRANLIQIAPLLNLDSNIGSSICHWIIAILELFKVVYYGLYLIPLLKLNLSFKWKQIALELGSSRQHKGICPGRK